MLHPEAQNRPHAHPVRRALLWPLVAALFVTSMVLYEFFMITQAVCDDLITWGEER